MLILWLIFTSGATCQQTRSIVSTFWDWFPRSPAIDPISLVEWLYIYKDVLIQQFKGPTWAVLVHSPGVVAERCVPVVVALAPGQGARQRLKQVVQHPRDNHVIVDTHDPWHNHHPVSKTCNIIGFKDILLLLVWYVSFYYHNITELKYVLIIS